MSDYDFDFENATDTSVGCTETTTIAESIAAKREEANVKLGWLRVRDTKTLMTFSSTEEPFSPDMLAHIFPQIVFTDKEWDYSQLESKKLLAKYFIQASSPQVGILYWRPHTKTISLISASAFAKFIAYARVKRHVVDEPKEFELAKCFLSQKHQLAELRTEVNSPRIFTKAKQLYVNEFAGFLHKVGAPVSMEHNVRLNVILEHIMAV
jgi:hypothetical protein